MNDLAASQQNHIGGPAPTQPAEALPAKKPAKPTTYRVFVALETTDEGYEVWRFVAEVEAHSDIAALKLAGATDPKHTYVAVPKRSFRERTPQVDERPPVVRY